MHFLMFFFAMYLYDVRFLVLCGVAYFVLSVIKK